MSILKLTSPDVIHYHQQQLSRWLGTILMVAIVIFYHSQITESAPCHQKYTLSNKVNFSFCCCRTLLVKTVDFNIRGNITTKVFVFVLTNVALGSYKNITNVAEFLYDDSKMACFSTNTTVINDNSKHVQECHCSNSYTDLNNHRLTNPQTEGFTCAKPKIFIGGFFDLHSINVLQTLPAAKIAIGEINANHLYFPEYELVLVTDNSTKNDLHHYGSQILLNHLFQEPHKVFFLGPSTNLVAKTVAAAASLDHYNVLQISSKTDDLTLTDNRVAYKNFFRLYPTVQETNDARIKIALYYKWNTVGLLYSSQPFYQMLNAILKEKLMQNGINVVYEESFHSNPAGAIQNIKNHGVKVIFGSYPVTYSSMVFCQIYSLEMFSPLYVFLMMGSFDPYSYSICSAQQVGCAARHHFFFNVLPNYSINNTAITKTRNGFLAKYKSLVTINGLTDITDAYYMYDAVWTMADILQTAKATLQSSNVNLDQIYYGKTQARALLRKVLLETDWFGLTGRIRFHSDGNRYADVSISQNLGSSAYKQVGEFETKYSVLRLRDVRWLGWKPHRNVYIEKTYLFVDYNLHLCLIVLALIGILFVIVLFVYLVVRRKTNFVRNSLWQVNLFVLLGALLVYASIIPFVSDTFTNIFGLAGNHICLLRKVLFCLGAALVVGVLVVKLQAVYKVLRKNLTFMKSGTMRKMLIYLFLIVMVTAIILLIWCLLTPFEMILKEIEEKKIILCSTFEIDFDPFLRVITYMNACSEFSYPFAVMILWLVALTLIALYMALKTRHMFITSMNDTWQCGLCIYVITFFLILGLLGAFLAANLPTVFAAIIGFTIWVCMTAVLVILFLHLLLNDPSNCCLSLTSCLCCATALCCCCGRRPCKGRDLMSTHEEKYRNKLAPSSPNESLSSKTSDSASLNDVDLRRNSSSLIGNKKKKDEKGCMKKLCCGSKILSWIMYGVPGANESDDNNKDGRHKTRQGRVAYRSGRKERRTIATQTESKCKINNNTTGNDIELQLTDYDSDGDGLKNGYTKDEYSPLKIYNKKQNWSHVRSYLQINGILNTMKKRKFSSTGDIPSLTATDVGESRDRSNNAYVISNPNTNKKFKTPSLTSDGTLESGGARKSDRADILRRTTIPNYKSDYSHIKSTINSGLSQAQVRRGSYKASPNSQQSHGRLRSTMDEKKSSLLSKKNLNHSDKTPVKQVSDSSLEFQSSPHPPVRIVNGPGSKPAPEQPSTNFLRNNVMKVTTLANTSSEL